LAAASFRKIRRLAYGFGDTLRRRLRAAKSLANRPKPAQPSLHSDIQVTHDCRHDPAGNTDLHRRLGRDVFSVFHRNRDKNRDKARTDQATIDFGE
jgi:hypothetical protein